MSSGGLRSLFLTLQAETCFIFKFQSSLLPDTALNDITKTHLFFTYNAAVPKTMPFQICTP